MKVRVECSVCGHQDQVNLQQKEEELTCTLCGHATKWISQDDAGLIEKVMNRQKRMGAMAFLFFLLGLISFVLRSFVMEANPNFVGTQVDIGLTAGAGLFVLLSIVCGALYEKKRMVAVH